MGFESTFIWYELMTPDTAAAAEFYGKVIGWEAKDSGMAEMSYTLFNIPGYDMGVAGMMELTKDFAAMGIPPNWTGYIAVDDVAAKTKAFADNGGRVERPPMDIPGIGAFSVVSDPHGATICLFKPIMPEGPMPPEPPTGTPGTFGWRELYAGNGTEAVDFYSKMFGWQKDMAVDMGAMGVYQTFKLEGDAIGGIMTKMPDMPVPFWNYYVNVDGIDAAAERVRAAGGKVLQEPMEVPGGSWIISCLDPQGAMFSLVSMKR